MNDNLGVKWDTSRVESYFESYLSLVVCKI